MKKEISSHFSRKKRKSKTGKVTHPSKDQRIEPPDTKPQKIATDGAVYWQIPPAKFGSHGYVS